MIETRVCDWCRQVFFAPQVRRAWNCRRFCCASHAVKFAESRRGHAERRRKDKQRFRIAESNSTGNICRVVPVKPQPIKSKEQSK